MSRDKTWPLMAAGLASDMKYTIDTAASIKEALALLDKSDTQTLFVTGCDGRMRGTLTDGDIRRGLLAGAGLDTPVSDVMHRDFKYLRHGADDVKKIYELSDQIRAGRTADELSAEINAIVRNATTLR